MLPGPAEVVVRIAGAVLGRPVVHVGRGVVDGRGLLGPVGTALVSLDRVLQSAGSRPARVFDVLGRAALAGSEPFQPLVELVGTGRCLFGPLVGGTAHLVTISHVCDPSSRPRPEYMLPLVRSADEVRGWVAISWPEWDWSGAVVEHGSFHQVAVLPGRVVARVATGPGRLPRVRREAATLELVADMGVGIVAPRMLSSLVDRDGACGYVTSFVPGRDGLGRDWAEVSSGYAALLTGFAAIRADGAAAGLPAVRAWCGGPEWPAVVESALLPELPAAARPAAVNAVKAVLAAEREAPRQFVHGDFGPHNVRWEGRTVSGILDLDHAALGDAAIDVAPLVGAYGAAAVADLVDPPLLRRALIHRATLPLQVAAAAELAGDEPLRDHAVANFGSRVAAGTLHDPGGRTPG